MKKFLFVALMTFVMVGFSSCKKDSLSGTKWTASYSETDEEFGTISLDLTLEFTTEEDGTLTISMLGYSESQPFTYTFDGKEGTMTAKDEEGEISSIPFTVDGDKLTMTDKDEDTGEPITIVFTKAK